MKQIAAGVAALWVCAAAARAIDFGAFQPQGYVSDFAGVVDASTRERLARYGGALERSTGAQLALVTVRTLGGEPPEDVANTLFRKWGVGKKGQDNGVLLLLSIDDHRSRLEVGYGLEPVITDGDAGDILRAMRPYLRADRYGDALLAAAGDIGSRIAKAKGVSIQAPAPRQPVSPIPESVWQAVVIFGAYILFFALFGLIGRRRRSIAGGGFWTYPFWTGTSPGWRSSGGGFGGFDSSDSFGGFGGGDSGGGGATSSW